MRALIQRVASASVSVEGERVAAIGPGLPGGFEGVASEKGEGGKVRVVDDRARSAERLAAALGVFHYLWLVKLDTSTPVAFALVLVVLLWLRRERRPPPELARDPVVSAP